MERLFTYIALIAMVCVLILVSARDLSNQSSPAEAQCVKAEKQGADSCKVLDGQYEARVILVDNSSAYLVVYQGSKTIAVIPLQ